MNRFVSNVNLEEIINTNFKTFNEDTLGNDNNHTKYIEKSILRVLFSKFDWRKEISYYDIQHEYKELGDISIGIIKTTEKIETYLRFQTFPAPNCFYIGAYNPNTNIEDTPPTPHEFKIASILNLKLSYE